MILYCFSSSIRIFICIHFNILTKPIIAIISMKTTYVVNEW